LDSKQNSTKKTSEYIFFQFRDELDNFRFEAPFKPKDINDAKNLYQLRTLNTFYKNQRSTKTLHTLYAINVDIDGTKELLPLSHIDILQKVRELGFSQNPSEINKTSEGHYHVIFRIEPARAFPEKISYWEKCARGLYKAFKDLGADEQATTNLVGYVRIPGHPNGKYTYKPIIESVYSSNSIFTLTYIYQVLKENGFVKDNKFSKKSYEEKIQILLKMDVCEGKRNRAAFTIALHFKAKGLSQSDTLNELIEWNNRLSNPLNIKELYQCVRSAYNPKYSHPSQKWLNWLIENKEFQKPNRKDESKKQPKRKTLAQHANSIREHILSNGGQIESSQHKLAEYLDIPWRSFLEAKKQLPELNIIQLGRGRNSKSIFTIITNNNLKLVQ